MPDTYDHITLMCRLKAAQRRNKELESGERYIQLEELHQKEYNVYEHKIEKLKKELAKLQKNIGGIKEMKRLPDAIFIVDPKKERICVQEAHTLGIPLIGICDTNCDPEELDYVIPGNDDSAKAIELYAAGTANAILQDREQRLNGVVEEIQAESAAADYVEETTEE